MNNIFKFLSNLIYNPTCIVCGKTISDNEICNTCYGDVHFLCSKVTAPIMENFNSLFSIAAYQGPLLAIVKKFKYGKGGAAAGAVWGLFERGLKKSSPAELPHGIDCIVPVPLGSGRYFMRGYNQSVMIAQMLSRLIDKPVYMRALIKSKKTETQVGKTKAERRKNLKGAFFVPRFRVQPVKNKHVLLVDDVVTSGATIDECARVLKRAGAAKVDVLTLAKTL